MKKLIVCFLSLLLVFNNFGCVFAEKGNPLVENPEYCNLVREKFKQVGDGFKIRDPACIWEKAPTNNDYRKIKVFNFPYLIEEGPHGKENNFIKSSLNMFLESTKIIENKNSVIKKAGKEVGNILRDELYEKTKGSIDLKVIADFLGVDEDTAFECFLSAYGSAVLAKLSGIGATCSSILLLGMLALFTQDLFYIASSRGLDAALALLVPQAGPLGWVFGVVTGLVICAKNFTGVAFEREKKINLSNMLASIYNSILNDPDQVLRCNVLVTAVDYRNFSSWSPLNWIFKPRNDGGFAKFDRIGDLEYAPKGSEYDRGLIRFFSELFDKITTKEHIDIEKARRFVNSGDWPKAPQIISDL